MSERLINAVGLSILHTNSDMPPTVKMHVTTVNNGRKADWIPVPGMCTFLFVGLPHRMTKPQAIEYLTSNENVKHILKKAGALDMSYIEDGPALLEGRNNLVIEHDEEEDEEEAARKPRKQKVRKAAALTEIKASKAVHSGLKTPKRP